MILYLNAKLITKIEYLQGLGMDNCEQHRRQNLNEFPPHFLKEMKTSCFFFKTPTCVSRCFHDLITFLIKEETKGPLLKEGNSVAMLSKEMLCYDWSKQQHSVSEQIKTQHLF